MIARALLLAVLASPSCAFAVDVVGVLPASLDQPRIYLAISRDAKGPPLAAKGDGGLAELLGGALGEKGDGANVETFAIDAFLDTGASGVMLSKPTAEGLGITQATTADGKPITFYDVGVGGAEPFGVTAPLFVRLADYGGNTDGGTIEDYTSVSGGGLRLNLRGDGGMMDQLTGGLDVAGMPVMFDKVMVVDVRPLADFDKLKTSLVAPNDRSIPATDVDVPLTYVDFARFTKIEPAGAAPIALKPNPMIGPSPFDKNDRSRPVTVTHGGKTAALTMLLDTGAASSFISTAKATELGVTFDDDGKFTNVPANEQFELPIGGIGGAKNVQGFYVDAVQLPASRGEAVRYVKAPVLVMDISVKDEASGQNYTLDGVFGMNYLVASASISMGLLDGGVNDIHDGAFSFFVIDNPGKRMGLKLK